jgi:hypothetical protein
MSKISFLDQNLFKEYCSKLNISKEEFKKDIKNNFRYLCFKLNYFMKSIALPVIKNNSFYEAVIVEFRELPHIEFIIRNAIYRLGSDWSFTVICGNKNYKLIQDICKKISANIKIINLKYDNISQQEYSNLLITSEFWKLLTGEKILIYQEDSLIFKNNINDFVKYDFIGAPFSKDSNDTPNCVGNGGLSLRTKIKMLEVIEKHSIYELNIETSTMQYMTSKNLIHPPEDVYFSKTMQENKIGDVADWDTAFNFSSELIFNPNSFGGHQFWISTNRWKQHINNIFGFKKYVYKSDIKKFLNYLKHPLNYDKTSDVLNAFDIDLYFFCKVNNIQYIDDKNSLTYLSKIGLHGFIYHPKQLENIFPGIQFYKFLNNIYSYYDNKIAPVQNLVSDYLYNSSFDIITDLLIQKKYDCLNDNYEQILLVFIGNLGIGIDLINKIIAYKNKQSNFNIAFCFNKKIFKLKELKGLKELIKNNFDFYAIFTCKELGTDITPTLLMYNEIIKNHNFKHIIKLHTKSIKDCYEKLSNYLLSVPLKDLLINQKENCNCIGCPEKYLNLFNDPYNNKLKNKYLSNININNYFVAGTIFYTTDIIMNTVLEFTKKNYRYYLLNNLYENNSINQSFSPIHFLERLFGVIKI